MKKSMNKILSLVLALAMVFSLSITVFAASGTASLEVIVNGEEMLSEEVEVTAGKTVYNMVNEFAGRLKPEWKPVPDWQNPDITYQALESMLDMKTQGVNEIRKYEGMPDYDYSTVRWLKDMPGYGLLSEKDGVYTYVYAGEAWTYEVTRNNKTEMPMVYMDQYELQDGDAVVLTYSYSLSVWTTGTSLGEPM